MKDTFKYLTLLTQVGLTITFTVFFFTILGVYLDRWLGTRAIFTLVFVLLGCIAGIWAGIKLILSTLPKDSEPK
ncbi:MAG TPA: F0F1 ATPase subunit [Firmicutes bacterium]|nr:F0F1 ATPase subunit [Bacillota bacterium]